MTIPDISIPERLKSRKFWASVTALTYTFVSIYKPELRPFVPDVITITMFFVGAQGAVDVAQTFNNEK